MNFNYVGNILDNYLNSPAMGNRTRVTGKSDFSTIISKMYSNSRIGATNFKDAFPQYQVTTHVGNTNVSSANWQRNDFPFWEYFNENVSADSLNDWKPTGANPPQTDSVIQSHLSRIGAGKMAILIPESLQRKMDADEDYARKIMAKVQKWKEDYDRRDNAAAASYGYNVAEHQFSKSYCIQLDENGDVANATITGGGRITGPSKEELEQIKAERKAKRKKQEEYLFMLKKSALKRKLSEQAENKLYYQNTVTGKMMSQAYTTGFIMNSMGVLGGIRDFHKNRTW